MDFRQDPQLAQTTVATPHLVTAKRLLEMATLEFQALVAAEQEENPALDVEERVACGRCGCPTVNGVCIVCEFTGGTMELVRQVQEGSLSSSGDEIRTSTAPDDDDFDLMESAASILSEADRLTSALQAQLPEEKWAIVDYLVGNLDADGRLVCSLRDASDALQAPITDVADVLQELQKQDPPGVGARDVRECLLIQLGLLEEEHGSHPIERALIRDHLSDLYSYRYATIASALGVSTRAVMDGLDFIRHNLNPFPGRSFIGDGNPLGGTARPAVPDAVVTFVRDEDKDELVYEIATVDKDRYAMHVARAYDEEYQRIKHKISDLSDADQQHILDYVTRATQFIKHWQLRGLTLDRVVGYLVRHQDDFVKKGVEHIKPLTRADVAQNLGLHESTISRAVADKHILLPDGRLVALRDFFTANLAIKTLIRQIIGDEARPLTDQEIVDHLADFDVRVSRRVVAKYRQQLDIAASPHRSSSRNTSGAQTPESPPAVALPPLREPDARSSTVRRPVADSAGGRAGD
ncbi:MAG TPA: hypothetical protein VF807_15130 [Ktedonobacterales bacterium]